MIQNGLKVLPQENNPLDNILLDAFVIPLNPYFKKMNFHPNHLTLLSFLFGIIGAYLVYQSKFLWAALFLFFGYLFDCFDGNYARTYNQVSKFGDFLDHFTDIIQFALLWIAIYFNKDLSKTNKKVFYIVTAILAILMCVDLGCKEAIYNKNESETLAMFKSLCIGDPSKTIHFIKYFSTATLYFVIIFFMFYFELKKQNNIL